MNRFLAPSKRRIALFLQTLFVGLAILCGVYGLGGARADDTKLVPSIPIVIGVVADRGIENALQTWAPTAAYLTRVTPGYSFTIRAVPAADLPDRVNSQDVDFVIVGPDVFVDLKSRYGVASIVTLEKHTGDTVTSRLGGVVFTRAGNQSPKSIKDLTNGSVVAVSRESFSGFQVFQREIKGMGLNVEDDFSALTFVGFPEENVVKTLLSGGVDFGVVRTGVLESMAAEGKLDLSDLHILKFPETPDFDLLLSTRLYPEWTFARLQTTDPTLVGNVLTTLLYMQPQETALGGALYSWGVSSSYFDVQALMVELRIGPYGMEPAQRISLFFEANWPWLAVVVVTLLLAGALLSFKTEIVTLGASGLTSRGRLGILTLCMGFVVFTVLTTTCVFLYQVSLQEHGERLRSLARSQAALIESVARFDELFNVGEEIGGSSAATIQQIQDSFDKLDALGAKEELIVASRAGAGIDIDIASHGLDGHVIDNPNSLLAANGPMRKALNGLSGILRYTDETGRDMLSAFEHIPALGKGIVAQVEVGVVRRPFLVAAGMSAIIAFGVIGIAVFVFRHVSAPMINRLEKAVGDFDKAQKVARVGNWEWNVKTGVVTWSDEMYRIFGEEPQSFEASYSASERKSHPDDFERTSRTIGGAIHNKENFEVEHRIVLPNGEVRHVVQLGEVIFNSLGAPIGMLGTIQDVTELKQFENLLADAISAISDGFALFDADERLVVYNQPYLDSLPRLNSAGVIRLGVTYEEIVRAGIDNNFVPPMYASDEEFYIKRMESFRKPTGPVEYETVNGRWFWFEERKTSNGGTIIVRGEITARKQAELAVQKLNENLEELVNERTAALRLEVQGHQRTQEMLIRSEQRHRAIVNTAADGIITINEVGEFTSFNNAAQKIFGWSIVDVIGKNIKMIMPNPYQDEHDGYLQNFLDTNEAKIIGNGREVTGLRRNGEEFPMDLSVSVSELDDGLMFTGIVRDISARKEAETKLRDTLERLQLTQNELVESEKMASLGGLVAGVAHEINTPIGISVTAASHLRDVSGQLGKEFSAGKISKSSLRDFLESADQSTDIILNNLRRAADLIRSFKQVAVDQSSGEHRRFHVGAYLDEVLLSLAPKIRRTGHRVKVDCDPAVAAHGDPGALAQIITNLVMNSLIHGFPDDVSGKINISVLKIERSLQLIYTDNGRGMDEKTRTNVFEPFFTTRRGQGGSGLGMNIVYNLVTQTLRGVIHCKSAVGEGVEFTITFPENFSEAAKIASERV